jgi:hypothetical protein
VTARTPRPSRRPSSRTTSPTAANVAYTWTHKGEEQPAVYTPYEGGKSISGSIIVDPLDVGGDVGKKNTADIKWAFIGEPELVDDLS